jgi:hypothetical protein
MAGRMADCPLAGKAQKAQRGQPQPKKSNHGCTLINADSR